MRVRRQHSTPKLPRRSGTAAVECAVISPVLILIVMGGIDVGQFVQVGQTVNNASREGARRACRDAVKSVSEVETSVQTYMQKAFPNVPAGDITSALTVTVTDGSGNAIAGGDLTTIASGESISVTVAFQYEAVPMVRGLCRGDWKVAENHDRCPTRISTWIPQRRELAGETPCRNEPRDAGNRPPPKRNAAGG